MADPYLYEFLYRGQPAGAAQPSAWHAQIAQEVALPGQAPQTVMSGALTPDQASAAGFPLSKIIAGINADALSRATSAESAASAAQADRDQHAAALAGLQTQATTDADTITRLSGDLDAARTDAASAQVDVRNLNVQVGVEQGKTAKAQAMLDFVQAWNVRLVAQLVAAGLSPDQAPAPSA